MNNPIFKRSDFRLCTVPVPQKYPQSQTHIGVAFSDGKYFLSASPYPVPKYGLFEWRIRKIVHLLSLGSLCPAYDGEAYENPCLYIEDAKGTGIPTQFKLMQHNALMETPEAFNGLPSYNSDPDIFIEDGIFYIMNRCVIRTKAAQGHRQGGSITRIYLMKGINENGHFKLLSNHLIRESDDNYVSPSLIKYDGNYIVSYIDTRLNGREMKFENLYLSIADNISDAIKGENKRPLLVNNEDVIPWHMSLFQYEERLYTIITCVKKGDVSLKMWQMLGVFNKQLTGVEICSTPLTDYNSYRGSALVQDDGIFVLYTPTVHEKIKGGNSVDGREVLVANMDFKELLSRISK